MRTRRTPAALLLGATTAALVLVWTGAAAAGAAWTPAGAVSGLGSGRVWSVAASPTTAGFYVAGTDQGVVTSTDSGAHWTASTLNSVRVWTVGFDVRDPKKIFAGTDGSGVQLSTDAGLTWTSESVGLTDLTVRALAFGLDGIAAGTNKGVDLSADGATWQNGGLGQYSISSLAVAANSPAFVVIATTDRGDLSNGYVFRYSGAGTTWQALQSGLPSSAVATSVAAGPLSAAVTKRPLVVTTSKGTFRSGDGGSTWTGSTGVPENLTLTAVAFSPLDPSLVYAGADQGGSNGGDVLRSTDGGSTFTKFDQGLRDKTRQVEAIAVAQTTPPVVVAALDPASGGLIWLNTDSTAPSPPALVAEAPGQPIPSTLATVAPTPEPSATPSPTAKPAKKGTLGEIAGTVFHWPVPLVFEVLLVLTVAYLFVRWRQRYYIEGPP